jgi:hypothetical protein
MEKICESPIAAVASSFTPPGSRALPEAFPATCVCEFQFIIFTTPWLATKIHGEMEEENRAACLNGSFFKIGIVEYTWQSKRVSGMVLLCSTIIARTERSVSVPP